LGTDWKSKFSRLRNSEGGVCWCFNEPPQGILADCGVSDTAISVSGMRFLDLFFVVVVLFVF
jgi:hypothetical protein